MATKIVQMNGKTKTSFGFSRVQPNFIERSEVKIRLSERKIQFLHSLFYYWYSGEQAFLSMAILPRKNGAEARLKWHSYNASTAKRHAYSRVHSTTNPNLKLSSVLSRQG
jgi:hypothetical protein